MPAQCGERLSGQMRAEPGNSPRFHTGPFGMRAGQAGPADAAHCHQRAGKLRLFAAQHLGHAGLVGGGQTRHQFHLRPVERYLGQCRGDLGRACRARKIRRLDPALPAADHAGQQHVALAGRQPGADFLAQGIGEAPVRHRHDAARAAFAVADAAVPRQAVGTEAADTPIDADHSPWLPRATGGNVGAACRPCTVSFAWNCRKTRARWHAS